MGVPDNKVRLTITMSKELDAKVRNYAESMGVTRGQFITMMVGQSVMSLEKGFQVLEQCGKEFLTASALAETQSKPGRNADA